MKGWIASNRFRVALLVVLSVFLIEFLYMAHNGLAGGIYHNPYLVVIVPKVFIPVLLPATVGISAIYIIEQRWQDAE